MGLQAPLAHPDEQRRETQVSNQSNVTNLISLFNQSNLTHLTNLIHQTKLTPKCRGPCSAQVGGAARLKPNAGQHDGNEADASAFFAGVLSEMQGRMAETRWVVRRGLSQMHASLTETMRMQEVFSRVLSEMQGRMTETRWKQGGCKWVFARVLSETHSQAMRHMAETRWKQGGCKWFCNES